MSKGHPRACSMPVNGSTNVATPIIGPENLDFFSLEAITIDGYDGLTVKFGVDAASEGGRTVSHSIERQYDLETLDDPTLRELVRNLFVHIRNKIRTENHPNIFRDDLCKSCQTSSCCRSFAPIWMTQADLDRMSSVLNRSAEELETDGCIVLDSTHWTGDFVAHLAHTDKNGWFTCNNLDTSKKPHRCSIYTARPTPCRDWKAFGCTLYSGRAATASEMKQYKELLGEDD